MGPLPNPAYMLADGEIKDPATNIYRELTSNHSLSLLVLNNNLYM